MRAFQLLRAGACAVTLLLAGSAPAVADDRGFPLIQRVEPSLPDADSQSFGIAYDTRGLVYVANGGGVLIYDGAGWRLLPVGEAVTAMTVASDARGRVAVGGIDDFGYLAPDGQGALQYVSLLPHVPAGQRRCGQVGYVHPTPEGFAFVSGRHLFVWDGRRVHTVAELPQERPFAHSFTVGETPHVWLPQLGLLRLDGTRLVPVPGGEVFRGRRLDMVLPADRGLLVSVRGEGLFLLRGTGAVEPFAPEASRWAAEKRLFSGMRLPDGRWALGSILGGLMLLQPDGAVEQVIDAAVGLPDDFVAGIASDREGTLWLALNLGLARIEVGSPLSMIDRRSGLKGSAIALERHQGDLWIGTPQGVFRLVARRPKGELARVEPVPGFPPGVWSFVSLGEELLVGTYAGLFSVRGAGGGAVPVEVASPDGTVYTMLRSASDPDRVWLGLSDGLGAVRREGSRWRWEGKVAGISSEVRSLVEGQSALWAGTLTQGLIRVELPQPGQAAADLRIRRIGEGDIDVFRIGGRILVVQERGIVRLDESRGELVADPALEGFTNINRFALLAEDADGNLWMSSSPPAVALRQGNGWEREPRRFHEVPARSISVILAEPDGTVWLGTDAGLIRHAGPLRGQGADLPAPLLSRVTVDRELVFGGAPGVEPAAAELRPDARRLRIEYGPLSFRSGLRYQTRLDPGDADWSEPRPEPFTDLSRLTAGDYTFRVRTVGGGEVGPETAWSFQVPAPWYQTPWAGLLGLALLLAALRGYSELRGRALRQRAARLEGRVAEQTVELRRTVEELRRAHDELAAANARLQELSLQDSLTGLANRRRLQKVLEQEWSRALRRREPLALCLLDLDHFKLLNDTRGHLAGDQCLQAVAAFLALTVGRTGDLVARYGGEELAVLLPATDLAGALRLAARLCQGIEEQAIPHPAAPAGRVTASVGVAALVPEPGQEAEVLIEAADLALYRAKAAGRNQVCAA